MYDMDFSEEVTSSYQLADTGVYELQIEDAQLKKTDNGKNYIGLTFVVRKDVEQPFAGVKIWDNIWENEVHRDPATNKKLKKEIYEAMTPVQKQNVITRMEYDDFKIRKLVHAQNEDKEIEENGVKKPNPNFKTKFPGGVDEVALFLNGLCVQAKVVKYTDERTGKERNSIQFTEIKRTSVSPISISADSVSPTVDIADDDLPF